MAGRLGKAPNFPIRPVLEYYGIHVSPRGKALCAWHDERTPSLSVQEFGYRCFACGASGDAIKLIREQENLDYAGALARAEELAGGNGSEVPRPDSGGWGGDLLA